ncbi:MAG: AAA family ATPase [Deltaproteobacteria bacterium]|nr:AAA family ATPase [Deltaproteobacteria bacterium]
MLSRFTGHLRGRFAHLSAACVLVAVGFAILHHRLETAEYRYEIRLHLIAYHGLSQAFLMQFPPHRRAAIIEYKRNKLNSAYTQQFWTHVAEMKSREVLSAALEHMEPAHRALLSGGLDEAGQLTGASRHLELERDGKSEILVIRARHTDPGTAADLAESVVASYGAYHARRRMRDREYAVAYLKETYERLEADLAEALFDPNPADGPRDVKVSEEMMSQRVSHMLDLHDRATMERIEAESAVHVPLEQQQLTRAIECRQERAAFEGARTTYLERHPAFSRTKTALDECIRRIDEEFEGERLAMEERARVARLKEHGYRAAALAYSEEVERLRLSAIEQRPREKEIAVVRDNTEAALNRYLNVLHDDRAFQPVFRVLDRAPRERPLPWGTWAAVAMLTFGSAGAAGGLLTARSAIRRRASGAAEIERLGASVIAEIPPAGHGARRIKRMLGMIDLYTHDRPASDTSERFKHLRTRLMADLPGPGPAAISITSSVPGEGKTFCAINTAIAFAAAGARTLVVDGDLKAARATAVFGLEDEFGLSDIVFNNATPEGKCRSTHIRSLSVLPAGTVQGIYSIDPDRVAFLLRELKGSFDRIIIDLPPLGASSDPLLVGSVTDGVILVAKKGHVPVHVLKESVRRLGKRPIRFLGTVLNWSGLASGYFAE